MLEKHSLLLSFCEIFITRPLCIRDCSKCHGGSQRWKKTTIFALKFTILIKIVSQSCWIHVNYQNKTKMIKRRSWGSCFLHCNCVFEVAGFSVPVPVFWKRWRGVTKLPWPGLGESQAEPCPWKQQWQCLLYVLVTFHSLAETLPQFTSLQGESNYICFFLALFLPCPLWWWNRWYLWIMGNFLRTGFTLNLS